MFSPPCWPPPSSAQAPHPPCLGTVLHHSAVAVEVDAGTVLYCTWTENCVVLVSSSCTNVCRYFIALYKCWQLQHYTQKRPWKCFQVQYCTVQLCRFLYALYYILQLNTTLSWHSAVQVFAGTELSRCWEQSAEMWSETSFESVLFSSLQESSLKGHFINWMLSTCIAHFSTCQGFVHYNTRC